MMKLLKMMPVVAVICSVVASSAFALGPNTVEETSGKMCDKLIAALQKQAPKVLAKQGSEAKAAEPSGSGTAALGTSAL